MLKENSISISQIFDNKYNVQFTKGTCSMLNSDGNCYLKEKTKENCYCIIPLTEKSCQNAIVSPSDL